MINQWLLLGIVAISVILYYVFGDNAMLCLLVSTVLLIYAVNKKQGRGILQNRVTNFISSVSMEIYLSHMLIFRVIDKLRLNRMLGNGWLQYAVTVVIVSAGAIVFALIMQAVIKKARVVFEKNGRNEDNGKKWETWVDDIKVIACVLVVLGHFFQSMTKTEILPANKIYKWFNQTIYSFPVPLLFICSGYLFQRISCVDSVGSKTVYLGSWQDTHCRFF